MLGVDGGFQLEGRRNYRVQGLVKGSGGKVKGRIGGEGKGLEGEEKSLE